MWKWLVGAALVMVLGCVGTGYWLQASGKLEELRTRFDPSAKPTAVRIEPAGRGSLVRVVSAPGMTEPKSNVEISAQVSARIIALPFRENDAVKTGDVVVRLDARDLSALLDAAKAELRSREASLSGAMASLIQSELELGRAKELHASGDITKARLDEAQAGFDRAKSQLRMAEHAIEAARANIDRAEKDLDNTVIRAPFDGVITRLNAEVGELVLVGTLNNPASVIMEIADLGTMMVKARIDESNVAPVQKGQPARIFLNAYREMRLTGKVEHVALKRRTDTDQTAYFEAEVVIDLPTDTVLRSGLTANVDIEVERYEDVLRVPSQAVLDRERDALPKAITEGNPNVDTSKKFTRVVFVEEGGKARAVPVKVGASDLTHTIIEAGLSGGERVIVGPFKVLIGLQHDQAIVEEGKEGVAGVPGAGNGTGADGDGGDGPADADGGIEGSEG